MASRMHLIMASRMHLNLGTGNPSNPKQDGDCETLIPKQRWDGDGDEHHKQSHALKRDKLHTIQGATRSPEERQLANPK